LPPEQQVVHDRQLAAERRAYDAEQSLLNVETENQQQEVTALRQQMDVAFARDDVRAFQTHFDTALGKEGAFRDEVLTRGDLAWRATKRRMTAQEAIDEVMGIYGPGKHAQAAPAPAAQLAPPPQNAPAASPQTNVLPNVRGSGGSPLKTKPKSIEDLRKLYTANYES